MDKQLVIQKQITPPNKPVKSKKTIADRLGALPKYIGQLCVVLWVVFTIVVIGWIVLASLSTTKEIFGGKLLQSGLHWENYTKVFDKYNVGRYFVNSAIYTVGGCIGAVLLAAPAAFVISNFKFRGKKLIETAYATTMGLPGMMLMVPLFMLVSSLKMTESVFTLIIIYIAVSVPFTMFYLTGFFATIPSDLIEAALIDGCTHIKTFWKVILPLAKPGIVTVTIFNFIGIWNEYIWALIFASTEEKRSLALGLQAMIQGMTYTGDWAGIFAAVIIVLIPTILMYALLSEKIMGGTTDGAVKG